jgi:hypothetical protein
MIDDDIRAALFLSHIETPTSIQPVEAGTLVDLINQQQIKTYALYPAKLPHVPDITDLPAVTPAILVLPPTLTVRPEMTQMPSATSTPAGAPAATAVVTPVPEGKGCLLGLLDAFSGLLK